MNIRSKLLLSCAVGAFVIGAGPLILVAPAFAADMPVKAMSPADPIPYWWFHGEIEAGGRFFVNNPQRNGVNSAGQNSLAKYYEYSTIKPGAFLDGHVATGSKDGLYQIDVWAKNVGYTDQKYNVDASKAGQHYLNFEWDQTPHVYSTSANTLYNGVGTNSLTLPSGLGTQLYNAAGGASGAALTATQAATVKKIIDANVHQTDIGIRRDTASVEYIWTPTDAWKVDANYSHLHRTGTQIDGVVFTPGTGGARVDAIKPVDDTTQNFGLNGEYAGTSPWNQKFNFKLGYDGSVYKDGYSSYTVQNPFCQDTGGLSGCPGTGNSGSYKTEQMPLWPDNQANGFTGTLGADLPAKSRYMGTVSYSMMRQNQDFLPYSINSSPSGWTASNGNPSSTSSLPASSLNGAINTLLVNNVVTTQITPDLKSKLTYRYYDYDNNTPRLYFKDWVIADYISGKARSADYAPFQNTTQSYLKQNAGADLTWRPTRQWNLGVGYGYERYNWYGADTNATNENAGKIFADWKPISPVTMRSSYLYSQRRYDTYNDYANVASVYWPTSTSTSAVTQNQSYRQLMFADRDRNQAKLYVDVKLAPMLTVTPTAGLKYDNYLNTVNLGSLTTSCSGSNCTGAATYNGVALNGTQPGLIHNNAWNWGLDAIYLLNPDTTFMVSYTREYRNQETIYCGNAAVSGTNGNGFCSAFSGGASGTGYANGSTDNIMKDAVDTYMAKVRYAAIPNKLDFDLGYTLSIANSSLSVNPTPIPSQTAGVATVAGGPYPDQKTTYQRFDIISRYTFDQDVVRRMGLKGDVFVKLRYAYERTRVTNWQNDTVQNYMWSTNNQSLGYMTWLAGDNPNYNVHLIAASLGVIW